MSSGIAAWGTYLPYWRLQRSAIAGVLGSGGAGAPVPSPPTTRTPPPWASRRAGVRWPSARAPERYRTCSSRRPTPAYLDKTSATTVHAALGLGRACGAYDFAGSSRSAARHAAAGLGAAGGAGGARPGRRRPTCARAWPARPRSATAATAPRPSCARPTARWPSWSAALRPATSSSTAGGSRARPTRTCGRSASARRCTCRWPGRPSPTR